MPIWSIELGGDSRRTKLEALAPSLKVLYYNTASLKVIIYSYGALMLKKVYFFNKI